MGLGSAADVSLSEAREAATAARKLAHRKIDPIEHRTAVQEATEREAAGALTFKACAEKYIADKKAGWSNPKHAAQWDSTLAQHVYPVFGGKAVQSIGLDEVLAALRPIWETKTETATRVRGRIENVLDYARVNGWRVGENPARWKGHLANILPAKSKVAKVEHHSALPWQEAAAFLVSLGAQAGMGAIALRFVILTACRTSEALGATWDEVSLDEKVWIIPAERMKARKEHRVPLSDAAMAVLEALPHRQGPLFPGPRVGKGLSNMALLATLKRMERQDLTAHGFRSTFRDWAAETGRPNDIAEAALAHSAGGATVVAYQRGDLLSRRRALMDDWAEFCGAVVKPT
jgi:integrase